MIKYDICVPKKYTKNGEEKTMWNRVGSLVKFEEREDKPEGFVLELSMFPETSFKVFQQKSKDVAKPSADPVADEVADEDIPF